MKKLVLIALSLFAASNMQAGKHKAGCGCPSEVAKREASAEKCAQKAKAAQAFLATAQTATSCKDKTKALHEFRKACEKDASLATNYSTISISGSCKHAKEQRDELAKIAIKKA